MAREASIMQRDENLGLKEEAADKNYKNQDF
jgi:hypothetical protein